MSRRRISGLRILAAIVLAISVQLTAPPVAAQTPVATDEVVVHAYPPHCHPRPGDPQDHVDLSAAQGVTLQQVIRRDPATGQIGLFRDDYPETGEIEWQRNGTHIDQFVFRVPTDDAPLCIGSRARATFGMASLRRAFAARPYWGKVVRFTSYVATRRVASVRLWVAAGTGDYEVGRKVRLGSNIVAGNVVQAPMKGNHNWTPVSYTVGPIPCVAAQISYGVILDGGGDVWIYKPALEEVPDNEVPRGVRHGKAFTDDDYICRRKIYGYDPRDNIIRDGR